MDVSVHPGPPRRLRFSCNIQSVCAMCSNALFTCVGLRIYMESELHISYPVRSRPLGRTCSAYPPTIRPFSARNCRRGNYLSGNPPKVICFLCFLWRSLFRFRFSFFFAFSFCFTSHTSTAVRVLFCIHKNSIFIFLVFSLQVTREDEAR